MLRSLIVPVFLALIRWVGSVFLARAIVAAGGALAVSGAHAEVIADLYEVRVPVASQSEADRNRAIRAGLAELLVRVSGDPKAATDPGVRSALANAQRYLEQYRYDRVELPAGPVGEALAAEEPVLPWAAVFRFARQPVDQLLRAAGLPVWSVNRPVVMVWLAKDEGGVPAIVSEAGNPELIASLRRHAARRGVILRFPLLDLDDLAAISADDVWRLDGLALQGASARYPVDAILAGRATEVSDGRWLGSWRLAVGEERWTFDVEGERSDDWLSRAIDQVANALASHYVVPPDEAVAAAELVLELGGIDDFRAYGEALRHLQRVDQVRDVRVLAVEGDRIVLALQAGGGRLHLERLLALDSRLETVPGPAADDRLRYRWRGAGG